MITFFFVSKHSAIFNGLPQCALSLIKRNIQRISVVNLSEFSFISLSKSIVLNKNVLDRAVVLCVFGNKLIHVKFMDNMVIEERNARRLIKCKLSVCFARPVSENVLSVSCNSCSVSHSHLFGFSSTVYLVVILKRAPQNVFCLTSLLYLSFVPYFHNKYQLILNNTNFLSEITKN